MAYAWRLVHVHVFRTPVLVYSVNFIRYFESEDKEFRENIAANECKGLSELNVHCNNV